MCYLLLNYWSLGLSHMCYTSTLTLWGCPALWNTYLGIFRAEMTHVVVDQAETETSVHDSQAPLRRESRHEKTSCWNSCKTMEISDKTMHYFVWDQHLKAALSCPEAQQWHIILRITTTLLIQVQARNTPWTKITANLFCFFNFLSYINNSDPY